MAQRGIMGFEPAHTRRGYIYNPDRNPNLLDMPAELPVDGTTSAWDKEADLFASPHSANKTTRVLHGSSSSFRGFQHHRCPTGCSEAKVHVRSHCGVLKKRAGTSARRLLTESKKPEESTLVLAVVKRMRK